MRNPLLAAVTVIALASSITGQAKQVQALERQLRNPGLSGPEFTEVADALFELGVPGARAVARQSSKRAEAKARTIEKSRERLVEKFERAARKLARNRAKGAKAQIKADREIVLRNTNDPSLTKDAIRAVSDPALERLREHLTVRVSEVFDDPGLAEQRDAFVASLDDVAAYSAAWARAAERLTLGDELDPSIARLTPPPSPEHAREQLQRELEYHAILAIPMDKSDERVFAKNRGLAAEIEPREASGVIALNELRVILGLNALELDLKLYRACRDHSEDMVEHDFFSHTSPVAGKRSFAQRAALAGTSASSENIARGHATGEHAVMNGWWYSPGHHRNMLGNHRRVGLGGAGTAWTQLFGG